jgi:hypothetical protein
MNEISSPSPPAPATESSRDSGSVIALPDVHPDLLPRPSRLARHNTRVALAAAKATLPAGATSPAAIDRQRAETLGLLHQAVERARVGEVRLSDDQGARLLLGLTDKVVRDRMIEWSCGARGEATLAVWIELVRRAVPPYDLVPLTLTAWAAWVNGRASLARAAVASVLARDPGCRLAWLVGQAMDRGLSPDCARGNPTVVRRPRSTRPSCGGRTRPSPRGPGRSGPPRAGRAIRIRGGRS